jgi:hypothetical protein
MDYPKLNDHWHVQYGEAVGKENNIIVKVIENKKELNPPNWRENKFKCEHQGQQIEIKGEFFVELFLSGTRVFTDTVSPVGLDILSGHL